MKKLWKAVLLGAALGLSLFAVSGIIYDIAGNGTMLFENWMYTKMAIGSLLVGLGFAIPSLIYGSPRLSYGAQIAIHMGVGCTVMLLTALLVGWIPFAAGWKICVIAVAAELLSAWGIWLCSMLYYRKLAKRMNDRLKDAAS